MAAATHLNRCALTMMGFLGIELPSVLRQFLERMKLVEFKFVYIVAGRLLRKIVSAYLEPSRFGIISVRWRKLKDIN